MKIFLSTLLSLAIACGASAAEKPAENEQSPKPVEAKTKMETATIAGGCFWCIEAALERLLGVESVESGYTNGKLKNPTYEQVCSGLTGHTEAVKITYDPKVISYEQLLKIFFHLIDPTQLNAQGPDRGTQYRSGIYYSTDEQKAAAEKVKEEVAKEGKYTKPIVTEIQKAGEWYPAEEYHQDYFTKHYEAKTGNWGYLCHVSAPKVEKLEKMGVALKPKK
jgi:peptide-methionine (S)-S-oxide reductase